MKSKIQNPEADLWQKQTENSNVIWDLDETLNSDEVSSTSSPERDLVMEDDTNPLHSMALFTIEEMEETDEERNNPNFPPEINLKSDDLNSCL